MKPAILLSGTSGLRQNRAIDHACRVSRQTMPKASPSCSIRRLEHADVPAILEIIRNAREEYGLKDRIENVLEPSDHQLFDVYRQPRAAYFVAIEAGSIAGGGGISALSSFDGSTCELQRMYLRPQSRGRGIGRMLVESCIGSARTLGFTRCYLETIAAMTPAISLYEASGFRRLAAPLGNTGHRHNDCWMLLELSADPAAE
jgi:putative acetyltransferase